MFLRPFSHGSSGGVGQVLHRGCLYNRGSASVDGYNLLQRRQSNSNVSLLVFMIGVGS